MGYIYALMLSKEGEEPVLAPILPGDEKAAKVVADRFAREYWGGGVYQYKVLRSEINWQPHTPDD